MKTRENNLRLHQRVIRNIFGGEITLYDDEACNLASINLEEFVGWDGKVDWTHLGYITRLVTRFLDTAIDVNQYPDNIIDKKVKQLRRLGLGIMSLHGALIKAGCTYSSEEGRNFAGELMSFITEESWKESENLARQKGVFPLWKHSSFVQNDKKYRNVAVTCIPPTGTIQMIVDTSSSGCEPIFSIAYIRRQTLRDNSVQEVKWVNPFFKEFAKIKGFWSEDLIPLIIQNKGSLKGIESIPQKYQDLFEIASEIHPLNHVCMQATLQEHVSNSISKTINAPNDASLEDVYDAFVLGWKLGVRGLCYYRDGSRTGQVLSVETKTEEEQSETIEDYIALYPEEYMRGYVKTAPRVSTDSKTVKLLTGCGSVYLTMTKDEDGNIDQTFVSRGSSGTCLSNQTAVSRLVSLALRGGISIHQVVDQLMSVPPCVSYTNARTSGKEVNKGHSCPSAIAFELKKYAEEECKSVEPQPQKEQVLVIKKTVKPNACPNCGETLNMSEGCMICVSCGYSRCD